MAGYGRTAEPGRPDLPQQSFLVALPPGATAEVRLLDSQIERVEGVAVAPPTEQELVSYDLNNRESVPVFAERHDFDAAIYGQTALYPASAVALGPESWLRDQRLVSVLVRPVQASPADRSLVVHSRLRIEVSFLYPDGELALSEPPAESAAFEEILRANVLNYDQARGWRQAPEAGDAPDANPCLGGTAYRVSVTTTGIYQISHGQFANLGGPWAANKIKMCHLGQEIRIRVEDTGDGTFDDSDDKIVFFGESIKTQETTTNIYWVKFDTAGSANGLRMSDSGSGGGGSLVPDTPVTLHLESDAIYYGRLPNDDLNDHWYPQVPLEGLNGSSSQGMNVNFTLNNKGDDSLTIRVQMYDWIIINNDLDPLHTFNVKLNGNLVGTGQFVGSGPDHPGYLYQVSNVSPANLLNGANTIRIEATQNGSSPGHKFLVDWVEITASRQLVAENNRILINQPQAGTWAYSVSGFSGGTPQIFDVTDPLNPIFITNGAMNPVPFTDAGPGQYAVTTPAARLSPVAVVKDDPSSLRSASNRADYLIITDPSLNAALAPLVSRRTSQGLVVKVVYVQDIFDEFSDFVSPAYTSGLYAPAAIREFLDYTRNIWQDPAPTYVVLAGNGSYDYRNIKGQNGATGNLVPVYLRSGVDSRLGETAADNQYVDFNGDDLAEMLLGRLAVGTPAEMTTLVNKIIAFETGGVEAWRHSHFFVADNGFVEPTCSQDLAGEFFGEVDEFLAGYFPVGQILRRAYFAPANCYPNAVYPTYHSHFANSVSNMETRIAQNINLGSQFVTYMGHSGTVTWGHEQFFKLSTVASLANGNRTPVMLPMTCLEGYYQDPSFDSLSEAIVKKAGGGAVASYAPTGLQVQAGHDFLLQGFYRGIYVHDQVTVGGAIMQAKLNLHNNGPSYYQDLQDTFMLLGDPALRLIVTPHDDVIFLPILRR
jgi:hypothetical protein